MRQRGDRQTHLDSAPEKKIGKKGKSSSLEDGSQTDVMDCGRVVVGHFPGQVSSKACSVVSSKYSKREPAEVSQVAVAVPRIVGQDQTEEEKDLISLGEKTS